MTNHRLRLRPATEDDARLLFDWRNDPQTRSASLNTGALVYEDHFDWLKQALSNPSRQILIGELEETGEALGTVRLDQSAESTQLSWTVAPEARGKGFAKIMVQMAVAGLSGVVCAEVKAGNLASQKVAEYAGLQLDHQAGGILYYRFVAKQSDDMRPV